MISVFLTKYRFYCKKQKNKEILQHKYFRRSILFQAQGKYDKFQKNKAKRFTFSKNSCIINLL